MLLYGDGSILRGRLGLWRKVDIPPYPATDGKDDVMKRRNSAYPACQLTETPRRRYSREMFEVVALFLGAYAVLEG